VVRLSQVNWEDAVWVQGMNRIRHAYLELAPELEPYFVTSRHDDEAGILQTALGVRRPLPRIQPFVAVPGVVALVDSVVAGAIAGIVGLAFDVGMWGSLALGTGGFVVSLVLFVRWAERAVEAYRTDLEVRFPGPESPARLWHESSAG
jgi:hypothetical protein